MRLLPDELDEQILDDGMHYERSPAYHCQVFGDLFECHAALPDGALRERLATTLRAMAQVLADLTHPDGRISLFNDGGLDYAHAPALYLSEFSRRGGGASAPRECFALERAGYFGVRDGSFYLLADAGDIAPDHLVAHGHADTLAFELSCGAQRLIVDAGVYEYGAGEARAFGRGTRAHNTVTLDGANSSDVFGEFRAGRRAHARVEERSIAPGRFSLRASHDGYAHLPGAPRHARHLQYAAGVVDVRDEILGGRGQLAESRLMFDPALTLVRTATGLTATAGDVRLDLETTLPLEIVPARWSPDMGVALATSQAVMTLGAAPCAGQFRIRVDLGATS